MAVVQMAAMEPEWSAMQTMSERSELNLRRSHCAATGNRVALEAYLQGNFYRSMRSRKEPSIKASSRFNVRELRGHSMTGTARGDDDGC